MGGFWPSKTLEEMNKNFPEYSLDEIYEIVEQAIAMTKVFETGDFAQFLEFYKTFNGTKKMRALQSNIIGMPGSMRLAPLASDKSKLGNHNDVYEDES
jgi:hypothetical protein